MKKSLHPLALCIALVAAAASAMPARAAGDHGHKQHAASELIDGEVRKVDKEAAKLTLRHAEIKSMEMPPMTMVFVVKDKAMLDKVQVGDKVRFKAVIDAGKFTVTEIQVVR